MEPITAEITLRPLRLGFLVNPRDKKIISNVMRATTMMWGGEMCPIIPVMRKLPPAWSENLQAANASQVSRGYIRFFEPDLLVQTKPSQLETLGISEELSWSAANRFYDFGDLVKKDIGMAADLNVGTNMSHIYRNLFEDEFQFRRREDPRIYHFSSGTADDEAFYEAAFGCFPKDKRLNYVKSNYVNALDAKERAPNFETWLDIFKNGAGFPLYYTTRDSGIRYADRSDPAIFILDPSQGSDLIDFWNFRLFTRSVIPVNVNWLQQSRDLIIRVIKANHRPLPTNPFGVMIHTAIHVARSLDLEEVARTLNLQDAKLPERSVTLQGWYEAIWRESGEDERVLRPGANIMVTKSRQTQLTPTRDEMIHLEYPVQRPDFEVMGRGVGPTFVNVVSLRQYRAIKEIAEALPAATFASRDTYPVRGNDQFVSREGYVTFHNFAHDNSHLRLASPKAAILSWLNSRGITATPSDAGRVAEQVIESVGGLNGTMILRERPIIEQLNNMARSRVEWKDGTADEFGDKTAPAQTWQSILRPINKKVFGQWKTLDRLVRDGILQLGLSPRCPHCTQVNWYSFDDVAKIVPCARCTKPFPFPQGSPKRDLFRYRVVGPFATPHFARGSYSVALTLHFLDRELGGMNEFTFSTGLNLKHSGGALETDFFAWCHKERFGKAARDPHLLVGECKSLGVETFVAKDFARLRQLGALFPGAFLVAATLKDEFSSAEIKGLKAVAKWGWTQVRPNPLILLTGIELFGEGPLFNVWSDIGGRRADIAESHNHIFDYTTLADASQQALLGMSSEEVASHRYKRSRALAVKRLKLQREI